MQDIPQETHHETTRLTQSAQVVLWEIDLTEVGGERYFFCNEQNEKGEPVIWQGRQYQVYPIQGTGFELNGKGSAARPTLTVSNLYGMVTGMAEDLQSLVGGTVVRRKVYARFLDAVNFVNGNSDADPEQEVISRWRIEQCSELSAVSASFVLSTPTETDGAVFPGRIMLANTCTWTYRGDECGYHGPAVADEYDQPTSDITKDKCSKTFVLSTPTETDGAVFPGRIMLANTCTWTYRGDECGYHGPAVADEYDQPTSDITKDKCSKCLSGCKFRNNVGNFGGFLSINKLSQ
ncbi:phage minor tail protein L [Escherichia coli]|uniref:phage minor tail protein L n=1 Tax=Escherichia coli TaxID=562 RepID=UPI000D58F014